MKKAARRTPEHWKTAWIAWDPYDVWHRLLRDNPVCVEDPSTTTGQMNASMARDFWVTVADFPDPRLVEFGVAGQNPFQTRDDRFRLNAEPFDHLQNSHLPFAPGD